MGGKASSDGPWHSPAGLPEPLRKLVHVVCAQKATHRGVWLQLGTTEPKHDPETLSHHDLQHLLPPGETRSGPETPDLHICDE